MAFKQFSVADIGDVTIYKRRGARSIRLTVSHEGQVRVTLPSWLPYKSGLAYIETKKSWLQGKIVERRPQLLTSGATIGQQHRLIFQHPPGAVLRSRLSRNGDIIIHHPAALDTTAPEVQELANRASVRALRSEAESVLPDRLRELSVAHDLPFRSASIRQLKGRWGSCDQRRHITLNLFIMQLPWELIDYVLLHELTHTRHLDHSADFWALLGSIDADAKAHRRLLRSHRPIVEPGQPSADSAGVAY